MFDTINLNIEIWPHYVGSPVPSDHIIGPGTIGTGRIKTSSNKVIAGTKYMFG